MERLTKVMHCDDGNKLYDYSNEVVQECKDFSSRLQLMFEKLTRYEDLEEQGLLLKMKHKIGDVVYYISTFDYVIEVRRISMITQKSDKSMKYRLYSEYGAYEVTEKELEKEYYSTLAEAEKALAEMEK